MHIDLNPRKFLIPEYIFGVDSRLRVSTYCKMLGGRKALLVTDPGMIKTPWYNELRQNLKEQSIEHLVFSDISANPRDEEVMHGKDVFLKNGCNILLALGGGSVMDCAKGIGIVSSNQGNIRDFEGIDKINNPMAPLICIPSTAGSASEVSQFAIINHTTEQYKFTIISKAVVPDVALIDPYILTTMDPFLTACTGLDALAHAFEAYVSNARSAVTNLFALESIKLIHHNLKACIKHPDDIQLRGKLMLASLYAGNAFSNASLGCTHSLAHSLGGYLDLPHGECNAILLPHVVDYNFDKAQNDYTLISDTLGLNTKNVNAHQVKQQLVEYLLQLKIDSGIKSTLKEKGVSASDIPVMSAKAIHDPCNATNPKEPIKDDFITIYSEAM